MTIRYLNLMAQLSYSVISNLMGLPYKPYPYTWYSYLSANNVKSSVFVRAISYVNNLYILYREEYPFSSEEVRQISIAVYSSSCVFSPSRLVTIKLNSALISCHIFLISVNCQCSPKSTLHHEFPLIAMLFLRPYQSPSN